MKEPITYTIKLATVREMIWAKQQWLEDFSTGRKKRPDHEIDHKRRELAVLGAIAEDYVIAVERAGA